MKKLKILILLLSTIILSSCIDSIDFIKYNYHVESIYTNSELECKYFIKSKLVGSNNVGNSKFYLISKCDLYKVGDKVSYKDFTSYIKENKIQNTNQVIINNNIKELLKDDK